MIETTISLLDACKQAECWLQAELDSDEPGVTRPDEMLRVLRAAVAAADPPSTTDAAVLDLEMAAATLLCASVEVLDILARRFELPAHRRASKTLSRRLDAMVKDLGLDDPYIDLRSDDRNGPRSDHRAG